MAFQEILVTLVAFPEPGTRGGPDGRPGSSSGATGPHALSVTDTDALLYLPGRDTAKLRLATQIPALSPGWQESFRELIDAAMRGGPATAPPPGTEPGARAQVRHGPDSGRCA